MELSGEVLFVKQITTDGTSDETKSKEVYEKATETDLETEIAAVGIDQERFDNILGQFQKATASSAVGLLAGLGPEAFTKSIVEDWLARFWAVFPGREASLSVLYAKVGRDRAYRTYRDDTVRHKDTNGKFFVQYLPYPPDSSKYTSPRTPEEASVLKEDRQFTKAYKQNVIGQRWASFISEELIQGVPVTFFDAPKPYGAGHVVLIPRMLENLPQLLTEDAIQVALELISKTKYEEHLKIGFNGLRAWASTDQLHLQPLFFEDENGKASEMPIEKFATRWLLTKDGADVSELIDYPTRGFVFQGNDIGLLTRVLFEAVSLLQKNAFAGLAFIPHNLIFTKENNGRIRVFLFPRMEQTKVEPYQIGAGFVELSGVLQTSDNSIRDRIIKDSVVQHELSRISLTPGEFNALKEKLVFSLSISPMQSGPEKKTGGIDLRALPMTIQPMGSFNGLNFKLSQLSQAELEKINVAIEIQQIKSMVQSRIIPSGERIKELVAACLQKKEMNSHFDDLLLCLADIFKQEEENASESSSELKEALVIVDSQS